MTEETRINKLLADEAIRSAGKLEAMALVYRLNGDAESARNCTLKAERLRAGAA